MNALNPDFLKGWRTRIVNIASIVVLLGGAMTGTVENPETLRWIAIAMAVANLVLRQVTSTAPGKSA